MTRSKTVFFWLGGVITQTVPEAVVGVLFDQPIEKVGIKLRVQLRQIAEDLYLGRSNAKVFCQQAIEVAGVALLPAQLEARLKANARLRDSVLEVISSLPDTYDIWLVSDYPPEWYESIQAWTALSTLFDKERVVFTSRCCLPRMVPDIFYYLVRQAGRSMDTCLIVDGMPARAVQAVRHGLSSAIFVDAEPLRREFILRRMLPTPPGFVCPGRSDV